MTTRNIYSFGLIAVLGMCGVCVNVANASCPTSCPDNVCWVSIGTSIQYEMSDGEIYRVVAAGNPSGSDTWSAEDWANYLGFSITGAIDYDSVYGGTWTDVNCNCVYEESLTASDAYGGDVNIVWWDGGGALPDLTVAGTYTINAVLQNPNNPPQVSCSNGVTRNEWYAELKLQPFVLHVVSGAEDCNTNGIPDNVDISSGTSTDADSNGIPDECQPIYVDTDATGTESGEDWQNAFTDLQQALQYAQAGDEIWVAQGIYYPTSGTDRTTSFELVDGVKVYGGFVGTETARDQRDWETNLTVLSGDIGVVDDSTDNAYHVIFSDDSVHNAALSGFTIQDGNADGTGANGQGGGWYNNGGTITVSWCTFIANEAQYGGAIYSSKGSSKVNTCYIQGNAATVSGGGIYADDIGGGLELNSCLIYANTSIEDGGAVYTNDADIWLNNCTIVENTAGTAVDLRVGGVYLAGSTGGTATINSSILWDNNGPLMYPGGGSELQIGQETGTVQVSFSNLQDGLRGASNIRVNPNFVDAAAADFRLACDSLSIDSGDPAKSGSDAVKDLSRKRAV